MAKKRPSRLDAYRRKRDFSRTVEPEGGSPASSSGRLYVIQKHAAGRLHYDLRLEMDGVLKSWAVPKGPSLDPDRKRMAVQVEDHPVEYGYFEGIIPKGEYGGGTVLLWDRGEWEPAGDAARDLRQGKLSFRLHGERLKGLWALARFGGRANASEKNWLLIKKRDDHARPEAEFDVVLREEKSVASGRSMEEIAREKDRVWKDGAASSTAGAADAGGLDPSGLPGARPGAMPGTMRPQLATMVAKPPRGEEWLHEIKYDGYRMLCFIDRGKVRFLTRRGLDWTSRFKEVAKKAASLPVKQAVLDGEMVVLDAGGRTDFQALQNVLKRHGGKGAAYLVFDVPHFDGYDLTGVPLLERKGLLRRILPAGGGGSPLRYSDHVAGNGEEVFRHSCRLALEGVVSKRAHSPYVQKRSLHWQKVKCLNRQEFVVGGFTDPGGGRSGLGALLLGYYGKGGKLIYSGRVGTGFREEVLRDLRRMLEPLERKSAPFANPPVGGEARHVHWVRPERVVEVEFASWTQDGRLRAPSFKGVREDIEAAEVRRENGAPAADPPGQRAAPAVDPPERSAAERAKIAGVRISHPGRILYPGQGVTKQAVAEFYERIADFAVPHIAGRPLTLVRCPRGALEDCFFQKHFTEALPEFARAVPIREKDGVREYVVVDDLSGVISMVQLGALEFHTWPCREDSLERPDRMVFDLDPDRGVAWEQVIEAALAVRILLEGLGLRSFPKTTGGKGIHVVVPIAPRSSWEEVKAFSRGVAEHLVRSWPAKYVATMSKSKRKGKVFIDHFRNSRGATSVAAYSTRARPGAPVSTPLRWEELGPAIGPAHYTTENLPRRLSRIKSDPWEGFFRIRQSLTKGMKGKLDIE